MPNTASLILALRVLADDLAAADTGAADFIVDQFVGDGDIVDYPTSRDRRARIAYLGQPGPGEVPAGFEPPADYQIPAEHLAPKTATA
ncbi:hypothetical protein [Streptomyces lydicus]|uniref:hypothetical protein n=1 Tax=Streptomyces lydicus TaxID=47763 RepID=UPI0036EA5495